MSDRRIVLLLVALGAAARLVSWALGPPLHPDEIFQYLEPPWQRLRGYGWMAWEWSWGIRSWVLPGYHGTWMVVLGWLGLGSGAAAHAFLQLHWAALTLLTIPVAYRAGGLWAAVLAALWPELVDFAPHTLTEVPSAILITFGYAHWIRARSLEGAEERRAFLWAGALLSFAVCLRLPNGPLALAPALDLLVRKRFPALRALVLAALGPLLFFGLVDQATWGRPFHSMLAFLDYNFIQGRAAEHGTSPWWDYLSIVLRRTSFTLIMLIGLAALDWRRTWPALLPAVLLIALLSTQAHKEERFLLAAFPLFAIAWGIAMQRRTLLFASVATAMILAGTLAGVLRREKLDYFDRTGLFAAQDWVGGQPRATGLLVEGPFHLSGGYFRLSKNLPVEMFHPALIANPIFSHAAVPAGSREEAWARRAGFVQVPWRHGKWRIWARPAAASDSIRQRRPP